MRYLKLSIATILGLVSVAWAGDPAPTKMTHLIVQMAGTDIPKDSFPAKPKIMWRASNRYCRVDEEPDPVQKIHGRMIVNEPDAWMVNLFDNTARHVVDSGPSFNCRLPIFAFDAEILKTKLGQLEFGSELEFFRSNGAKQVEGPKLSFEANYYELALDGSILKLVERADIHAPIRVGLIRGDKYYMVTYSLWDDQVPFKADLFAKPAGMKIEEAK
jgi:hypothetical protein